MKHNIFANKQYIIWFLALFLFVSSDAQIVIKGTVTDEEGGEPLIGATITVDNSDVGTITDVAI